MPKNIKQLAELANIDIQIVITPKQEFWGVTFPPIFGTTRTGAPYSSGAGDKNEWLRKQVVHYLYNRGCMRAYPLLDKTRKWTSTLAKDVMQRLEMLDNMSVEEVLDIKEFWKLEEPVNGEIVKL